MASEGVRGDLHLQRFSSGTRRPMLAFLFRPGTTEDLLPRIKYARVLRVRQALTIAGLDAVPRGRKKVEHYLQTWVCSVEAIPIERWPDRPRREAATGFHPDDDDAA